MGTGSGSRQHSNNSRKQLQTVELRVTMDCDGCVLKVKKTLSSLDGVESVEINKKQQKVTVTGYVEANKVLKKAKSMGKKAEIWPYMPYNMVANPYIVQAYDKKAPRPYALCPMPYALCPMPYALCPMPYVLCPMPYALCPMPYALCPMPYALSKGHNSANNEGGSVGNNNDFIG
ncbi:hypothetical protein V8G54_013715 [Vigna mungo]|uniref:HMA domain-containing protein n=1 Tax=Vigna mungo TaxID=3915 RepID=A0AAQ3NGC0_VIGMU